MGVRFDLCDRSAIGPCPPDARGRLRLVLQPRYTRAGATFAHDVALHTFYPIPANELGAVVGELRRLSWLQREPPGAPLAVSPAAAAGDAGYLAGLRGLVLRYARAANLVRLTVIGQVSDSAAFAWIFRGIVRQGGGANALWWDAASSTLYLTDSNASSLMTWTDADGLQVAGAIPADEAGVSLGGIVRRGDGTLLISSFGFGTHGGMIAVTAGTASVLTGLDPARRRVGLAQDPEGTLYSAYFVGGRGKPPTGGVATVTIAGLAATETEIASGFHKVVGLVATPTAVFVSDQTDRAIYRIAVPGYAVTKLASVPAVDLLANAAGRRPVDRRGANDLADLADRPGRDALGWFRAGPRARL